MKESLAPRYYYYHIHPSTPRRHGDSVGLSNVARRLVGSPSASRPDRQESTYLGVGAQVRSAIPRTASRHRVDHPLVTNGAGDELTVLRSCPTASARCPRAFPLRALPRTPPCSPGSSPVLSLCSSVEARREATDEHCATIDSFSEIKSSSFLFIYIYIRDDLSSPYSSAPAVPEYKKMLLLNCDIMTTREHTEYNLVVVVVVVEPIVYCSDFNMW